VSTDREVTSIVRSWLEEGVNTLPDRVLDSVLDQLPATPQRRAWWPGWRLPKMNHQVRIAVGAVALVVLALIAFSFVPKAGGVGGSTSTASPSPSVLVDFTGRLPAGTFVAGDPFPIRVTFSVPAGWQAEIPGPYAVFLSKPLGPAAVNFSIFSDVDADPCHARGLLNPPPGPTVDDLSTALASLPGLVQAAPTEVTFGGYSGKQLTLTAPATFGQCILTADGTYEVWELPLGATNDLTPGEIDRVWILDVAGQRLVIDAPETPNETAQDSAEVQAVLDSIRLVPPPTPSPAPSLPATATP
jgi:hypothetical protein